MNSTSTQTQNSSSVQWVRLGIGLLALAALVLVGRQGAAYLPHFTQWVESLGATGPLVFMAGYAVAVVAFIPGSVLTLAAGAIFGIAWGTVYAFVGATIGAALAFLVSRYLARDMVTKRLAGNPKLEAVDKAIAVQGGKIVFLLRLSPVFPFSLLNYALGLTRVGFSTYLTASIGMIPGTLLYVYYGKLAGDVASLASGSGAQKDAGYWSVLALGLLATVAVTAVITRVARRALDEASQTND